MKVAVVGCGYVGLVSGVGLASVGHDVSASRCPARRQAITAGMLPFHEPGLNDLLNATSAAGSFATAGDSRPVRDADVILVAVRHRRERQLDHLPTSSRLALQQIARELADAPKRPRVVAIRSTVVPERRSVLFAQLLAITPGWLRIPVLTPRVGGGGLPAPRPESSSVRRRSCGTTLLRELYQPLGAPIVRASPTTAELAKYASNALLATLISFSNEIVDQRSCRSGRRRSPGDPASRPSFEPRRRWPDGHAGVPRLPEGRLRFRG